VTISRRQFIQTAAGSALAMTSTRRFAQDPGPERRHPNVLFIAVDDLNDWIGPLGGHPQVKTPHLDRLADLGFTFTNAHCPAPICTPARTGVLTGILELAGGWEAGEDVVREEIRITLLHEIGHHFGLDEDDLAGLGYE